MVKQNAELAGASRTFILFIFWKYSTLAPSADALAFLATAVSCKVSALFWQAVLTLLAQVTSRIKSPAKQCLIRMLCLRESATIPEWWGGVVDPY
jgi:hypothetical protein